MPELPEMENYRLLLLPRLSDRAITLSEVQREKSVNVDKDAFIHATEGAIVTDISRRAKQLLFLLNSGNTLLLHLMLGGWLFYGKKEEKSERSAQIVLHFGEEGLYFHGLRLGYLHLLAPAEREMVLAKLGPEPLTPEFTAEKFSRMLSKRKAILKTSLTDQSFLSGIGNCYSDEICFAAGLLPTRSCSGLNDQERLRLYASMRSVLGEAVRYGGYMAQPLFVGDRQTGGFDERCKIYDRGGEPCYRCGQPIVKTEVSSRKCFFCTNCQH